MDNSVNMAIQNQKDLHPMFSIDAPANVENLSNFYKCCGGLNQIGQTFKNDRERLQFRFRPDDPNSIPLFSERRSSVDLVVKVRRKRQPDGTFGDYRFEPYGIINTTFHFDNTICDMQLLPTSSDIRNELMKSDFILNCDPEYSIEDDQSNTLIKQYFYSRFIQPKQIFPMMQKEEENEFKQDLIRRIRKSRKVNAILVRWDGVVPSSMPTDYDKDLDKNLLNSDIVGKVREKFQQRPIWSRYALLCHLKCSSIILRYVLPLFAYFFENGPFRNLWMPYGYDPRKDPKSKIYQNIEVRVHTLGNSSNVETSNQLKKISMFSDRNSRSNVLFFDQLESNASISSPSIKRNQISNDEQILDEKSYLFRPGHLSTLKRTTFQLCDIELKEVQLIVHENDGHETEFTEKDGWLAKGSVERIRLIMNQELNKILDDPEISERLTGNHEMQYEDIEVSEVFDNVQIFDHINDIFQSNST